MTLSPDIYPWILLAEFAGLIALGWTLLRLVAWEQALDRSRDQWLARLRESANRLRRLRRQLEKTNHGLPGLELSPANRRKWQLIRWIAQRLAPRKTARS